ncbi:hypothetical protein CDAR_51161 [Caerostris darwini]|uniref:Uncharacterized protein n=1 Tax=Caerostris darwini TaxID=1538125 RepID=A0AAV4U5V9_9ARAC|nr:hypothetical protein CDAR_51161 [Caerostris darwini]
MVTFLFSSFRTPGENWWGVKGESVAEGRPEQTTSIELEAGVTERCDKFLKRAHLFHLRDWKLDSGACGCRENPQKKNLFLFYKKGANILVKEMVFQFFDIFKIKLVNLTAI